MYVGSLQSILIEDDVNWLIEKCDFNMVIIYGFTRWEKHVREEYSVKKTLIKFEI